MSAPPPSSSFPAQPAPGYTISGLLLLTATSAIVAESWRQLLAAEQAQGTGLRSVETAGVTVFFGLLFGGFLGVWCRPRFANSARWAAVGFAVGSFVGPLLGTTNAGRSQISWSLLAGAIVLVVLAATLHYFTRPPSADDPTVLKSLFGNSPPESPNSIAQEPVAGASAVAYDKPS